MDPSKFLFDVEAYKKQSEIEDRYIINRFMERRNKIEEDYAPRSKRKYVNRDYVSSRSNRGHESDASDSNSIGSNARSMGRNATKEKGKKKVNGIALKVVNEEWNEFKQFKMQKLEQLDKIALKQEEANQLMKESIHLKKMKMFMKLSSKEHLDDKSKELLEKLDHDLFEN